MNKTIIYLLMLTLFCSFASALDVSTIKAYYASDNLTANFLDETSNNYDGSVSGVANTSGIINSAGLYDDVAGDYIDLDAHAADFNNDQEGTLCAWIYPEDVATAEWHMIISGSDKSDPSSDLYFAKLEDDLYINIREGGVTCGGVLQDNAIITANRWQHVCVVKNATGRQLYHNGTQVGADNNDCWFADFNDMDSLRIGNRQDNGGQESHFDGRIDEIMLSNESMSATDISDLYNYGLSGVQYPFPAAVDQVFFEGQEHNNITIEGTLNDPFYINVSYNNSMFSNLSLVLTYDGTDYAATETNISVNYSRFNSNITIPLISSTSESKNFFWNLTMYNISGGNWVNEVSSTYTQTIFQIYIYNCSSGNVTLEFLIRDEQTNTLLNSTFEAVFDVWYNNYSMQRNHTFDLSGRSNYSICISPQTATYYTDAYIKYETDSGFTHRYYLINETLTNTSQTKNMYNFNTTTGISDLNGVARHTDTYAYFENVIAMLERRYLADNVWRTVQMDETGDFGAVHFNIIEETVDYRLLFYDRQGHLLKTTESMKFLCTSGLCELTFLIDEYAATTPASDLVIDWDYDSTFNTFLIDWSDSPGETATVRTVLTKETMTGTTYICNQTQTGTSGNYTCNATSYTGDVLLWIEGNDNVYYSEWQQLSTPTLSTLLDSAESAFWTFALMLTIVMFGVIVSPVAAIIATIFGLIVMYFVGLLSIITTTFVIIAGVMAVVISLKVRT